MLVAAPKAPKKILYSDMGADPRRGQLIERLVEALAELGIETTGLFYKPERRAFPYLTVPQICKPMNDPRFKFMQRLSEGQLAPDIRTAALIQSASSRYNLQQLAGRYLLFKHMISEQLKFLNPDLCVIWHQFNSFHAILAEECRLHGIPVAYAEHGVLPGTACFEFGGQMGESWIARNPARLKGLPLPPGAVDRARQYLELVRTRRISRKDPGDPLQSFVQLSPRSPRTTPVVFYAGQNDPKAGMIPTDSSTARLHSPHFASSFAALEHLAEICQRRNWILMYKAHPQTAYYESIHNKFDFLSKTQVINVPASVDIYECIEAADVTVTILSQTAYLALTNDRPTVLLGRIQLSGSGATYEIGDRAETETALEAAIGRGFTDAQRAAFVEHVARLSHHYCCRFVGDVDDFIPHGVAEVAALLARGCGLDVPSALPAYWPESAALASESQESAISERASAVLQG